MTPIQLNFYLFVATVVAFAWVGFSSARRQRSTSDYFHHSSLSKNVVSLTATNLTLGSGLVYILYGAQLNGLLMLLPVICVGVGYWLQALFLERVAIISLRTGKNFLASIDSEITKATGKESIFAKAVSAPLVCVFVLLLAFEIFASAKIIAPFLFEEPTVSSEIILSVVIFCITVFYAILGGIRAVFNVDFLQVPLICMFLPVFFWVAIPDLDKPVELISRLGASLKTDPTVLAAVLIACINSIATQFYSILNWGAVSNVESSHQTKLLRWVGVLTSGVLILFVLVGLLQPSSGTGQAWQELVQHLSSFTSQTTAGAFIFSGIIVLGLASILLTTTDAVVVNCVMFWFDNIAGGNSKDTQVDEKALSKVRWIGATTFATCFGILLIINYAQPDPFYLLLSMAGGIVVFAPMIVTAGYLSSRGDSLKHFTRNVTLVFLALFLASGVADVFLLSMKSTLVPYVGLSAFVISTCVSLWLVSRASPRSAV